MGGNQRNTIDMLGPGAHRWSQAWPYLFGNRQHTGRQGGITREEYLVLNCEEPSGRRGRTYKRWREREGPRGVWHQRSQSEG